MAEFTIGDVPANRAADLEARRRDGNLTSAESLAFAIIRGGSEGETGVPAMIDAATEEFAHGSYRIPIRVVTDVGSALFVVSTENRLPEATRLRIIQSMKDALDSSGKGTPTVLLLDGGLKLEAYEIKKS